MYGNQSDTFHVLKAVHSIFIPPLVATFSLILGNYSLFISIDILNKI